MWKLRKINRELSKLRTKYQDNPSMCQFMKFRMPCTKNTEQNIMNTIHQKQRTNWAIQTITKTHS